MVLEGVEQQKLELEKQRNELEKQRNETMSWKGKNDQLDYKMNLLSRYEQLKLEKGWDDQKIVRFFPEMSEFVDNLD